MYLPLLFLAFLLGMKGTSLPPELPTGWHKAGSKPEKYEMGIEKGSDTHGKNAASIKSIDPAIEGFGTLMQTIVAKNYLGKRVRMSGLMKSKDVNEWAGFWLRVDQPNSQQSLSFDNMQDRAVKGTTDWKKYEIVLDVPNNASNMAFGALISGTGQIWFDDLTFEIVNTSVPTTAKGMPSPQLSDKPVNLSFED